MINHNTPSDWEKEAYNYFMSVMKKKDASRHSFLDARLASECLLINFCREKTKRKPDDAKSALDTLGKLKALPQDVFTHLNFIRIITNPKLHIGPVNNADALNTVRIAVLFVFKWYFISYRKFKILNTDFDKLNRDTEKITEDPIFYMDRHEMFSDTLISNHFSKERNKPNGVKLETTRTPIFGVFVIDMSGSMTPYREDVISAHKLSIQSLRGSAVCINKQFYLTQYVFNEKTIPPINQLEIVRNDGNDKVILLDHSNYIPKGGTALYDTLEFALENIYEEIAVVRKSESKKVQLSIAIITDGEDLDSKNATANTIKNLMSNLLENDFHYSSVVIGLTDPKKFSKAKLEDLRSSLGFSEYISIDFSDSDLELKRKKVREAFRLGSLKLSGK